MKADIWKEMERAGANRRKYLDAIRGRSRKINNHVLEVRVLTKERTRKAGEELSMNIKNELNEASARRQSRLSTANSRFRSHVDRALEQRAVLQKGERIAAEMLSKKLQEKIKQASLKRQDELNARKSKLQEEFVHASEVKQRKDIAREVDEVIDDQSAKLRESEVEGNDRTPGNATKEPEASIDAKEDEVSRSIESIAGIQ